MLMEACRRFNYSLKLTGEEASDLLYSLVNRGLDSLPLGAEAFALLPAHLHEHSETEILHRQFELFVFRVVRVSTFLHVKRNKLLRSGYQANRMFSIPNILFQFVLLSMRLDWIGFFLFFFFARIHMNTIPLEQLPVLNL